VKESLREMGMEEGDLNMSSPMKKEEEAKGV
jgi:hypothetical protein